MVQGVCSLGKHWLHDTKFWLVKQSAAKVASQPCGNVLALPLLLLKVRVMLEGSDLRAANVTCQLTSTQVRCLVLIEDEGCDVVGEHMLCLQIAQQHEDVRSCMPNCQAQYQVCYR